MQSLRDNIFHNLSNVYRFCNKYLRILVLVIGPKLLISKDESIKFDQPLISNLNTGEFGLGDGSFSSLQPEDTVPKKLILQKKKK